MRRMDAFSALVVVVFQLFFGWCTENPDQAPPPATCESAQRC